MLASAGGGERVGVMNGNPTPWSPMQHTKRTVAFARAGRLTPEEMDLGTETRDVWMAVTSNRTLRERLTMTPVRHIVYRLRRENDRSDPLEQLDRLIITMAAVGFPESTVQLLIAHLNGVIARCYTGNAHRDLAELDLEETKLEAAENELMLVRRIAGEAATPDTFVREAEVNELGATLQFERAKELRRRGRSATRVLPMRREFMRPMGVSP